MSDLRAQTALHRQVDEWVRNLELVSVTFDRVTGEVRNRAAFDRPGLSDLPAHITVLLGHRYDGEGLAFRHDVRVVIGEGGASVDDAVAVVEASIVVQFRAESPLEPDEARAHHLGRTYSHDIMYPYLRELVQSTLARLGVAAATLGFRDTPD